MKDASAQRGPNKHKEMRNKAKGKTETNEEELGVTSGMGSAGTVEGKKKFL